jgi:EAL domain-containing protein (putative c-di-GMP-specific phosphodiesterase class I)
MTLTKRRIRTALRNGEIALHFQPKIELDSGRVIAVEALSRWNHPDRGVLSAEEWIPEVEDTKWFCKLDAWVAREAIEQARSWEVSGRPLICCINVSPHCLAHKETAQALLTALSDSGLDPGLLTVEITETAFSNDPDTCGASLRSLAARGIKLALDDFGVGYSSLARLVDLPIREVKIDQSFVTGMVTDDKAAAVVRGATRLAHSLGLTVVAEGIEDKATYDQLKLLGCERGQGFLISPAKPPDELWEWIDTYASTLRSGV